MTSFKYKYLNMKKKYIDLKNKRDEQYGGSMTWTKSKFNNFLQTGLIVEEKSTDCKNIRTKITTDTTPPINNGTFSLIYKTCYENNSLFLKINLLSNSNKETSKITEKITLNHMTHEEYDREINILTQLNKLNNKNFQICPKLYYSSKYTYDNFKQLNLKTNIKSDIENIETLAITVISEIEGIDLDDHVDLMKTSIDPNIVHDIVMKLIMLHQSNYIHDDCKFNNILVTPSTKKITLIDFGEAKSLDEQDIEEHNRLINLPLNIDHVYLILSYTFYLECQKIFSISPIFERFKNKDAVKGNFLFGKFEWPIIFGSFVQFYWLMYISLLFLKRINKVYECCNNTYNIIRTSIEIIWQGYNLIENSDALNNVQLFADTNDIPSEAKKIVEANCAKTVEIYLNKYWTAN